MTPELLTVRLTRKELMLLPMETRRRILSEQQDALLEAEAALNNDAQAHQDKRHQPSGVGEAPPVKGEVRTAPLCEHCGQAIAPTSKMTLEQVLAKTQEYFGKFLCYQCAKSAPPELRLKP